MKGSCFGTAGPERCPAAFAVKLSRMQGHSLRKDPGLTHKRYRFHDMRGTFATRPIQKGVNLITVRQLTGHSTVRMLEVYAKPGEDIRRDAINSLDKRRDPSSKVVEIGSRKA